MSPEKALAPHLNEARAFVTKMACGGNIHLCAISEGSGLTAKTFNPDDGAGLKSWIVEHNCAGANIYFTVNRLRDNVTDRKAKRDDIDAALSLHVDIDELGPQTVASIDQIQPVPSAVLMSGGGYQLFWKLDPEIHDLSLVEDLNKHAAKTLGGDHCHNIDRIMRVPGTINWPNKKKRLAGRVPVLATLLKDRSDFDLNYKLDDFSQWLKNVPTHVATTSLNFGRVNVASIEDLNIPAGHIVNELIVDSISDRASKKTRSRYKSRSEIVFAVIFYLVRLHISPEKIAGLLTNEKYAISERVLEQADPVAYCEREIARASAKLEDKWPDVTRYGKPIKSLPNALMACGRLEMTFEFDAFHNRKRIGGHQLQEYQGDISDDAAAYLRKLIIDTFGFDPGKQNLQDAITILCVENRFHPIRDYLDGLEWDGHARIETFFVDYFGADDTPLNRAAAKIMLTAAVRRIKDPGCKYDLLIVLEGEQGTGKSTALIVLAGEENFSDQSLFTLRDKEQVEAFEGVWIFEVAELDGMSAAEVSRIKALITRRFDQTRPAYARFKEVWPRQSIMVGTTNDSQYLKDTTGNRRFLPVKTTKIDLAGLRKDRDQIWAEAVVLEAAGFPIYLTAELEELAKAATQTRMLSDPWLDILERVSGIVSDGVERVATVHLFGEDYLNMPPAQLKSYHYKRAAGIMKNLGWEGPTQIWIEGKKSRGYSRPTDKPDPIY